MDRVMRASDVRLPARDLSPIASEPGSLLSEIAQLQPCHFREAERRLGDRRSRDAVLFAGDERRSGERRAR